MYGVRLLWVGDRVTCNTIGVVMYGTVKEANSNFARVQWDGLNHLAIHDPALLQIAQSPSFFDSDEVANAMMDHGD